MKYKVTNIYFDDRQFFDNGETVVPKGKSIITERPPPAEEGVWKIEKITGKEEVKKPIEKEIKEDNKNGK